MTPPDWPTGAYEPAPAPQPADLPLPDPDDPDPVPEPVTIVESCPDPDCVKCRVARVGAARICELVGVDYAGLERAAQGHYEHVATEVMAAMGDALIEWGVAVIPGEGS